MAEYRIDDLARAAGTTTRNVRAYQERGLLPPPTKRGRVGIYDDGHLERLKVIDNLLTRGFTMSHISEFLTGWETGKDLAEVLGLQHAVTESFAKEEAIAVPSELVRGFLGDKDADLIERVIDAGLVRRDGDTLVFTEPELLEMFAVLSQYGFSLRRLVDLQERTRGLIDEIAKAMIDEAKTQIVHEHGEGWLPEGDDVAPTAEMLNQLRALGVRSVHAGLARSLDQNLERVLGDYLATAIRNRTPASDGWAAGQ